MEIKCPFCKVKMAPLTNDTDNELQTYAMVSIDVKEMKVIENVVIPLNACICTKCYFVAPFHAMPEKIVIHDKSKK